MGSRGKESESENERMIVKFETWERTLRIIVIK